MLRHHSNIPVKQTTAEMKKLFDFPKVMHPFFSWIITFYNIGLEELFMFNNYYPLEYSMFSIMYK